MQAISLYSGAGGMDHGFSSEGIDIVRACEIDPHAARTLRANMPDCDVYEGDVRVFAGTLSQGDAGIVFGGPPCQGYSVAGKMDPDDPRSAHVWTFLETVSTVMPRVFVMENVDSLATLAKWHGTFQDIADRAVDLGYGAHSFVLNANDFGVPQNRRRMFMFGVRGAHGDAVRFAAGAVLDRLRVKGGGGTVREVLESLGPAGTARNPATCPAKITYAKKPVMRRDPYAGMMFNGAGRPLHLDRPAPTMAASMGGNKTHFVDEGAMFSGKASFIEEYHRHLWGGGKPSVGELPPAFRRLTLNECMAFQTFPPVYVLTGPKGACYRQIGNAVPCELARAVALCAKNLLSLST